MFTIVRLKQVILRTSKKIINLQVRGFLPKKGNSLELSKRLQFESPTFAKLQESKLTPEGYSVIYVSPIYHHLNFGHCLLIVTWPLVITYFVVNLQRPEWDNKKIGFLHSSKGAFGALLLALPIVLHWFLLRNVRVIFKKNNNEFKTLIYGIFGPFRKIYVDHGKYSFEKSPNSVFFHYLKNRRIIIFKESFYDELDYFSLIFTQNRDRSVLD